MKCIIYCRKSTDRDDKQAISLEHQVENCRRQAASHSLEVVEEILESRSAKTKRTRPGFSRMVARCTKWGIDYIVVDELKRLSRNTVDGGEIIELLDDRKIKGVITTGKFYDAENHDDTMMLSIQLVFSKKENQDRSRDTRAKMETCIRNQGRLLVRAPLGYKNVRIDKNRKGVEIDPKAADFIKEAFRMRIEGNTFREIAQKGVEMGFSKDGKPFAEQRIKKILSNRFYCGVIHWGGSEYPWTHEPLVSLEIFNNANGILRVFHNKGLAYRFQKMIKDEDGIDLCPYEKDGKYVYYHTQRRSKRKANLSEKKVFKSLDAYIDSFSVFQNPEFEKHWKDALYRLQTKFDQDRKSERSSLIMEKEQLEKRKNWLIDLYADRQIAKDEYNERLADYKSRLSELENRLEELVEDWEETRLKVEKVCELVETACQRYKSGNEDEKVEAIKNLQCELFAQDGGSLLVKGKRLIHLSKLLAVFLFQISSSEKASRGNWEALSVVGDDFWYSQGESNPCYHRERVVS